MKRSQVETSDASPHADAAISRNPGSRPASEARPTRPPAITDVARVANVSYQTVSRVLNRHPSVRESTRARVLAAIEQLGYVPNNAARSLVTGRSQTLGVLALEVEDWSGLTTLYGIEKTARAAGYYVSIATLDAVDRATVRESAARLAEQSVAGLLVIAPIEASGDALMALPADLPAVAIEGDPAGAVATITVDQVAGAAAATRHLLELGHETVFHVAGPREWMQTQERISGWTAALEESGAEITMPLTGDWSARSGYEIGRMLARIPELTAVFVSNDQMSLGLLLALRERGLDVPGDVSVVGFDDIPEAAYFAPPLTTVHQDFQEVGRQGLGMLLAQIESGRRSSERRVVEAELILRSSTGPVRPR